MTTKLIKHEGYWIVVDDKESITKYSVLYSLKEKRIYIGTGDETVEWKGVGIEDNWKVVIFSQNPSHNLPTIHFSYEVAKELGVVDVKNKVTKAAKEYDDNHQCQSDFAFGFYAGCNQYSSDNADKKFTLEELKEAVRVGVNIGMQNVEKPSFDGDYNFNQEKCINECRDYIQSLTKEEYFCEVEMEYKDGFGNWYTYNLPVANFEPLALRPKITKNSVTITKIWK